MLLAGSLQLDAGLAGLAELRPVFHSEADFQLAFAWQVRGLDPSLSVRLETRPAPGVHLDLLLSSEDAREQTAIELKYLTRSWADEVAGERFELKDQGAQDTRMYDVVKDVVRVERFAASRPGSNGAVVCIANDPSYWSVPKHGRETNAHAFRIHEGSVLEGTMTWGPHRGRQQPDSRGSPDARQGPPDGLD